MEIVSTCPFAVSTMLWQPRPHAFRLTVSVKATFTLLPGGVATIAPSQEPFRGDVGWDDDAQGSLYSPTDMVPFKRRADILLAGLARAPGGVPVECLYVQLAVGGFRKTLAVTGRRAWVATRQGLRPGPIAPFQTVPLRYELGTRSDDNPIGVDAGTHAVEVGQAIPSITTMAGPDGTFPVAGFGPLRPLWRARRHRLSDAGLLWALRAGVGVGPPPEGFDYGFFNAAPPDQQIDTLPPGLPISLENLSPLGPRLETRLPALRVKLFRLASPGTRVVELDSRCDTLWIDAERSIATLVWRASTTLDRPDDASVGRIVVVAEAEGTRITATDVDRFLRRRFPAVVQVALEGEDAPTLPREQRATSTEEQTAAGFPLAERPSPPGREPQPTRTEEHTAATFSPPTRAPAEEHTVAGFVPPRRPGLPFDAAPEPLPFRAAHVAPPDTTLPDSLPFKPVTKSLPFEPQRPTNTPVVRRSPISGDDTTKVLPLPSGLPPEETLAEPPRAPASQPADAVVGLGLSSRLGSMTLLTPHSPPPLDVLPSSWSPRPIIPPPPASSAQAVPSPREIVAAASEAPLLPLGVYCAIKAETWGGTASLREVLGRHGIEETDWRANEARQVQAMADEAAVGRSTMAIALLDALKTARPPGAAGASAEARGRPV